LIYDDDDDSMQEAAYESCLTLFEQYSNSVHAYGKDTLLNVHIAPQHNTWSHRLKEIPRTGQTGSWSRFIGKSLSDL
jgi:hypothetical protein